MEQSRFDIQYAAMRAAIIEREFQHLNEKQREARCSCWQVPEAARQRF